MPKPNKSQVKTKVKSESTKIHARVEISSLALNPTG